MSSVSAIKIGLNGYPGNVEIHVEVAGEPGGTKLSGNAQLFVRHTATGTEEPFANQGVVIPIQDGKGSYVLGDLREFKAKGWDTLVVKFDGAEETCTMPELPATPAPAPTAPTPAPQSSSNGNPGSAVSTKGLELTFERVGGIRPVKRDNKVVSYSQATLATVFRDGKSVSGVAVDFYRETPEGFSLENDSKGTGQQSDRNGNVGHTFVSLLPEKGDVTLQLRAQIRGVNISKTGPVQIPRLRDEDEGATGNQVTITATPDGGSFENDKMVYTIVVQAANRVGKNIAAGQAIWNCAGGSGTVDLTTGYAVHNVEIAKPGEHTYTVYSATASSSSRPVKLTGPRVKQDKPKTLSLEAKSFLTDFSTGKAVHTVGLVIKDEQGKEVDPGKNVEVEWTLGSLSGTATLVKGSALVKVTIAETEAQVAFNAVCIDPILALNTPLTLSGPPKKAEEVLAAVTDVVIRNATDGVISCSGFKGMVDIAVMFEGGKVRPVEFSCSANHQVKFQASDGTPLGAKSWACKGTTDADGTYHLLMNFTACGANEVDVKVSASSKSASAKLKYKMF